MLLPGNPLSLFLSLCVSLYLSFNLSLSFSPSLSFSLPASFPLILHPPPHFFICLYSFLLVHPASTLPFKCLFPYHCGTAVNVTCSCLSTQSTGLYLFLTINYSSPSLPPLNSCYSFDSSPRFSSPIPSHHVPRIM